MAIQSPAFMLQQKKSRKMGGHGAEETKINFFEGQFDMEQEKPEEDQILETKIDPLEWKQEIDRVYRELVKIEQEVEIARKQGGDGDGAGEECRRHIELIVEMCKDIKGASHHEVRKVFAHAGESLEDELAFIRKNEIRINKQNNEKIMQLGQITKKKKSLAQELRSLISQVKNIDYENKELQTEI